MQHITTIGLDLAKSVVQVHGMDHEGPSRTAEENVTGAGVEVFCTVQPCLVGLEVCGSAHHWT